MGYQSVFGLLLITVSFFFDISAHEVQRGYEKIAIDSVIALAVNRPQEENTLVVTENESYISPEDALDRLISGNERYSKNVILQPRRSMERREEVSSKQNPFAIIVGCSDSRVSPELVFDQGIGDLFVIRDAGNVLGPIEQSSVEFSAEYLGSSLIFVLGHERCGAVTAVLNKKTRGIEPIANKISQAIKEYVSEEVTLEKAIKANVKSVVQELKYNPIIADLMRQKKLGIVGGYYQLSTGKVELCCDLDYTVPETVKQ